MEENSDWIESVLCTIPVRMSGEYVQCGFERPLNAFCPNAENHIIVRCHTCGSSNPTFHNMTMKNGAARMLNRVCIDPWHSSTHQGREMMNKLVGHAYYDQVPLQVSPGTKERLEEVKSMEFPEVSGGGKSTSDLSCNCRGWTHAKGIPGCRFMDDVKYPEISGSGVPYPAKDMKQSQVGGELGASPRVPVLGETHCPECGHALDDAKDPEDPAREARRRASGPTEGSIAGAVANEEGLPGTSDVSGRSTPSQAFRDALGDAYLAMNRARESMDAYDRLLQMLQNEKSAKRPAASGKVRSWEDIYGPVPDGPQPPKHGMLATITGAPGLILVYLSEMHPVDGPGWYPIGEQAIGPLVEDAEDDLQQRESDMRSAYMGEVGHKARSDQARADFDAAQQAYDGRVTLRGSDDDLLLRDSEDDLTPGGTVDVSHGEHGGQEMPGMWDESDVSGGEGDVTRRAREPYERFMKATILHEFKLRNLIDLPDGGGRDPHEMLKYELIQLLRADDMNKKARAQRQAEEA